MKNSAADIPMLPEHEIYQHIFKNTGTVIFIAEKDSTVSATNLDGRHYYGFPEARLINSKLWLELLTKEDRDKILYFMENHEKNECICEKYECVVTDKNDDKFYISKNISPIPNSARFVISIVDITEQKKAELALKESQKLASFYEYHDHLTQLPNRELFVSRLDMEMRGAKRRGKYLAVLCIGLDRLKAINEIYGPANGDMILKDIGYSLKNLYRNDDFISRFEGDKFMVLLSDLKTTDHVIHIVNKTLNIFRDPVAVCGDEITLSASIGVSIYPSDGKTAESLTKNAETAMFMAKEKRRGGYQLFDQGMHDVIENKFRLTQEMYEGIEREEFVPYYQPKVDSNGALAGMEALVRWNNPKRGMLMPLEFIALAEDNGMIVEIGYHMIRKVCSQIKNWESRGSSDLQVAVNLSPVQFQQPDLIPTIKQMLKETGLRPSSLEFEITESGIMQNEDQAIEKLRELLDIGVDIAIDDFGTGYSSLYRLQDYPVTRLKIDKSFLEKIHSNPKTSTITTSIIQLAHKLGFKVVAEGIEHHRQFKLLKSHLCDYFQGFFFDQPLHPEIIEKNWLFINP